MQTQLTSEESIQALAALREHLRNQIRHRNVFRPDRPEYTARQYAAIRCSISALRKLRKMERAAWVCEALAA